MLQEILLVHHTHTDIGYTHDQPIVWALNRQFIDDMLDQLDRTQDWPAGSRPIWTCEVTQTLRHWLATTTPANVQRFRIAPNVFAEGLSELGVVKQANALRTQIPAIPAA
jgi:hypothetical protein